MSNTEDVELMVYLGFRLAITVIALPNRFYYFVILARLLTTIAHNRNRYLNFVKTVGIKFQEIFRIHKIKKFALFKSSSKHARNKFMNGSMTVKNSDP